MLKKIKINNTFFKIILNIVLIFTSSFSLFSFWDNSHQNSAQDAFRYMEQNGSNQQRWATDYLKARAGGRISGDSFDADGPTEEEGVGDEFDNSQAGAVGIMRAGAVAVDYFRDSFWEDDTTWNYRFTIAGETWNFTSWTHFINMSTQSDAGISLVTNNYNNYDGYSYNASYGFPDSGYDQSVAAFMNDAWMSIDIESCTDCDVDGGTWTVPDGNNPAIDYKQNGSKTPLGSPVGARMLGTGNGTNYNCFSDSLIGNCPDSGYSSACAPADCAWNGCDGPTDGLAFQRPGDKGESYSTNCYVSNGSNCDYDTDECGPGAGHITEADEDWLIYEPADNAATYYYNEHFLEGGASRDSTVDQAANYNLDETNIVGRYYNIEGDGLRYLALVLHYVTDMNVLMHIWNTLGYNHSDYEGWIENAYGSRVAGGSNASKNFEDYTRVRDNINSRANHYDDSETIERIMTENAFLSYLSRFQSGYDSMSNSSDYENAAKNGVNQAIASMVIILEKGVLKLRAKRN